MTDYRLLAEIYEPLGQLYTGGAIRAMKRAAAARLGPGSRVLCVGGGAGEEALFAARAGAKVTLLDRSRDMLATARRTHGNSPDASSLAIDYVEADLDDFPAAAPYDYVWSHFFLNVFARQEAQRKLDRLSEFVVPGGSLVVSDFAPGGWLRQLYFGLPLVAFWALTGNAWHAIYDYSQWRAGGLDLVGAEPFPLFGWGPRWLTQWTWRA